MSDDKILSKEEVDALVTASAENHMDLGKSVKEGDNWITESETLNRKKMLTNIIGLTVTECEKSIASFLRKKLNMVEKNTEKKKISEYLEGKNEKYVYTLFEIMPNECYGLISVDLPFLHQAISLLYGGVYTKGEPIIENPGKIGMVIAEKISQLVMEGFSTGLKEYGQAECHLIKTITQPHLSSKLSMDDEVYIFEMTLILGETESVITMMVMEEFFKQFFTVNVTVPPVETDPEKQVDTNNWRTAIEAQVADTSVVVQAVLPNVTMKLSDLMSLKDGALIPISDPTLVYITLHDLKLFRASAGQTNSKRVVKILGEV